MSSGTEKHWPALAWEQQIWRSTVMWGVTADQPSGMRYSAAVPPMIAARTPAPSPAVAALADEATRALSRFDAELGSRLHSFAPVLLRSESASSSQIEHLSASARAILSAEIGVGRGGNAVQITANTRALQAALELSDALSLDAIARMHEVLMAGQTHHTPGRWREEAVWIGTRSDSPRGAEYVAPAHVRVVGLLEDLVAFIDRMDVQPLIAAAIAHAQFETVHPFTDGNGRVGRALTQAQLRSRGVTTNVAIPVSAGLLADVEGYHGALMSYRHGDIDPIVAAFAHASLRAVANARALVGELDAIGLEWRSRVKARSDSAVWRLLEVLLRHPVLDAATAARELGVQTPNAYPPLRALVDVGILKAKEEHRRGTVWRSDEVLAAIDGFARRAGRRQAR